MSVLVDSSIWIEYFRRTRYDDVVDMLIEENLVITNQLILAELIPPLHMRNQKKLIALLREIKQQPVHVDWDDIVKMQIICLRYGINGVGLPDLIIAQNAIQGDLSLLSADKHFNLLAKHIPLSVYRGRFS